MNRLLILIDVPNWAYAARARALAKYAPDDFLVTIAIWPELTAIPPHDLVFNLDSSILKRWSDKPHVLSWNSDPLRRRERWPRTHAFADWIICNNLAAYHSYGPAERTCAISNGIDADVFRVTMPIADRPDRVFWTGSANPAKAKGYDILNEAWPELERRGFEVAAFPVESAASAQFCTSEMVREYNRSGYVLCLSASDSTPNTTLEGMACGCCLVTTAVGNVLEFAVSSEPIGVIIERSATALISGMESARAMRVRMAEAGCRLMHSKWSYGPPGNRAQVYFDLFRRLIRSEPISPFSYTDVAMEAIA